MDVIKNFRFSPDGDNQGGDGGDTKTFTQEELNKIVSERLGKERDKYTRERSEFIKKLGVEKEEDIELVLTKARKADEYETELETLKNEKILNERKQLVSKAGVDDEFIEYVLSKVPNDEKFEENLKKFVEANPKYTKEVFERLNSAFDVNGKGTKKPDEMTTQEYLEWRKTHNLDGTPKK
jgi:hypothetical protein